MIEKGLSQAAFKYRKCDFKGELVLCHMFEGLFLCFVATRPQAVPCKRRKLPATWIRDESSVALFCSMVEQSMCQDEFKCEVL